MTPTFPARIGLTAVTLSLAGLGLTCDPPSVRNSEPVSEPTVFEESNPRLPGFDSVDDALQKGLDRALKAKGPDYVPRTRHLRSDGSPEFINRLIEESSPYLLQHAHNPVSWYPWSDEAFERAKRENKPIFLSIGYSTCHWCHVMERESFEDEEIAAFLNRHFIAIKVDREERPDVDSVYMTAVNLLTGRGGWPMTVILTPDKEPFFGGTYFPPRRGVRGARAGLIDIVTEMVARYNNDPASVVARGQEVSQQVERVSSVQAGPGVPTDKTIAIAASQLATSFDRIDGGFTGAPKFPQPSRLALLLRYARRTRDEGATAMVTTTLDRMASGGIYDHVGGGFHRYSTDAKWLVPHFEKMLYDNAQLAALYLEAWQHTGDRDYARVSRDILDYVTREMTAPGGGFYSATDADSLTPEGHDEEGWFFTWTPAELDRVLGKEEAALVSAAFGVTDVGNFEGRNILHRAKSNKRLAAELKTSLPRIEARLTSARVALYEARARRPPPDRDNKIIAAWNGLMISAFARAGWALREPRFVDAASRAAHFVLDSMRDDAGRLVRTSHDENKSSVSFLDDYTFMVGACLDLYEATGVITWLDAAIELQDQQDARFLAEDGGYFLTPADGEELLVREKPVYDGAVPSGNSMAANNLLRLADFTADERWSASAEKLFMSVALRLTRSPTGSPLLVAALDRYYDVPLEVAIVSSETRDESQPLQDRLRTTFVPNKAVAVLTESEAVAQQARVPWLEGKRSIAGKPTAYVCERGRCELPTSNPDLFAKQLAKRTPYPSFEHRPPQRLPFERQRR
jgi:uncharacterized protein YyaL (SSP411 family)